jgi:hypothetical protein
MTNAIYYGEMGLTLLVRKMMFYDETGGSYWSRGSH